MVPLGRNRSEGWRHAKLDGHANEELFADLLLKNEELVSTIESQVIKDSPKGTLDVSVDGAKHVDSIFGDKTTSKVDLAINWSSGEQINISLKKSEGGQAWLISVPRFISAVEFHLNHKLDPEVKIGISLFIGGSNLTNYEDYFNQCLDSDKRNNPIIAEQEIHQRRLVATSIESNFPSVWESTLNFFNTNIALITRLSFAQGLAKSEKDAADVIIYNKAADGKSVFPISRIVKNVSLRTKSDPVIAGSKNGGSTLQLPTGSLQMHHPQGENLLQFRHDYKKISTL
jgi:hypothetical protein